MSWMSGRPETTEQRLSLRARTTVAALGGLALVLNGVGVAYAASDGDPTSPATWVTVENEDNATDSDCPLSSFEDAQQTPTTQDAL